MLLDMEVKPEEKENLLNKYNELGQNDVCIRTLIIDKLITKALNGDIRACSLIVELSGEKPKENEPVETRPPIINIEVVDNKEVEREFMMYEEADRTGLTIEEVRAKHNKEM